MTTVGYARVSTDHQNLAAQHDALAAAGCERGFAAQLSGVAIDRPGLSALLDCVRPGDTVVVVALDRLGPSLSGVITTIETLTEAGALLKSLHEGIGYPTATGKMLAGIFAALATTFAVSRATIYRALHQDDVEAVGLDVEQVG